MKPIQFVDILPQPNDITCGPTSLHAVYNHFGLSVDLLDVISTVLSIEGGGTLAVMLGIDALKKGFDAKIYSYNLKIFDPSWEGLSNSELVDLLEQQLKYKTGKRFEQATRAYQKYLLLGGKILFDDLHPQIFKTYFDQDIPILTGLSATYLYNSPREYTNRHDKSVFDDLRGEPMGHFVVLSGMDESTVFVADPYKENPISGNNYYQVDTNRLMNSILLGIVTYDANMLIIMPKKEFP